MDEVMFGQEFNTVGKYVLRKRERVIRMLNTPTKTMADLLPMLQEMDAEQTREARHVNSIVLIYGGDFGVEAAFGAIAGKFLKFKAVFCVGLVVGELVAYINKKDHNDCPATLASTTALASPGTPRSTGLRTTEAQKL